MSDWCERTHIGKQIQFLCLLPARQRGLETVPSWDYREPARVISGDYSLEIMPETLTSTICHGGMTKSDTFENVEDMQIHVEAFAISAEWVWDLYCEVAS